MVAKNKHAEAKNKHAVLVLAHLWNSDGVAKSQEYKTLSTINVRSCDVCMHCDI